MDIKKLAIKFELIPARGIGDLKRHTLIILYSTILSIFSISALANKNPNSEDVYKSPAYVAAMAVYESKDFAQAIKLLTPFGEQGTRGAQFALTQIYGESEGSKFANAEKAFKWHKIGALNGVMWSQHWMGHYYKLLDNEESYKWYLMSAKQGYASSQIMVGSAQFLGELKQKFEPEDYLHWFTLAAESGDIIAIALVGDIYYFGDLGEPDYDEALKWYRKIASENDADPEVIFKVGEFHRYGYVDKVNYLFARIEYERAANKGHQSAQLALAQLYFEGAEGVVDYKKAFEWCQKASKQGNPEAQVMLGMMHELGLGVDLDFNKALSLYQVAASEIDSAISDIERITKLLQPGYDSTFQYASEKWDANNKKAAFNLFQYAASKGHSQSKVWVGYFYENGIEIDKDLLLAKDYYGQAAKKGNYEAMYRLGLLHEANASNRLKPRTLSNTEKNKMILAIQALKRTGQSFTNEETFNYINYGNPTGPIIDSEGSTAEYRTSITWFMKAAKGNHPQSFKKLADFYEKGLGVKQNYYKAYFNYLLAEHYGDEDSMFLAELVGDYLSETEKKKALELIKKRISQ